MKLLLDENLSVRLPERLAEHGIYAVHVVHRGLQGKPDKQIWEYANEHDLIVVTINVKDFLSLAADTELHTGVIALRESGLNRSGQEDRILTAIQQIQTHEAGQLLNQVLEVRTETKLVWHEIPPTGD